MQEKEVEQPKSISKSQTVSESLAGAKTNDTEVIQASYTKAFLKGEEAPSEIKEEEEQE